MKFNHEAKDIWEAVDVDKDVVAEVVHAIATGDAFEGDAYSHAIEYVWDNRNDPNVIMAMMMLLKVESGD